MISTRIVRNVNVKSARCLPGHYSTRLASDDAKQNEKFKSHASVVIIGGGAAGTSAAYHLAKQGMQDVVLLEKSELTAGSTWHAAGLTTYYHPGINLKRVHYHSLNLYKTLEAETGQHVGLHTPGSLRLVTSALRLDEAKYQMTRQHWNQAEQHLLTPNDCYKLFPFLKKDVVIAGIWTPGDGHIDPYMMTHALAKGARMYGAQIYQQTPVLRTHFNKATAKWQVETPRGVISAEHVVNAAGFWGGEVAKLAGVDIHLVPVRHQYIITGPIDCVKKFGRELPVIRDLEGSYYLRQEREGLLFGPYENMDRMVIREDWIRDRVPPGFGKELWDADLDSLQPYVDAAMDMVPVLKQAEIRRVVSGPITYSPENVPLLGPYQGLRNYWTMLGFGYGIVQAGGAGKYIADWIINGEPPYDLIEVDANRFGKWCTLDYALIKARETYGLNNVPGYPKEERFAGRPTSRRSDVYRPLKQRGAQFGFHNGWEQPHWFAAPGDDATYQPSFRRTNWFEPVGRECKTVTERCGVIDLTPFAKFRVTGPGASQFLDIVCANSLPKVGSIAVSEVLTPSARVYAEVTLTRLAQNEYLVITGSGSELHDLRYLEEQMHKLNFAESVRIENVTDEYGVLSVAGPQSRQVLSKLGESAGYFDENQFKFMQAKWTHLGGVKTLAVRISYSGELGWELYHPIGDSAKLYNQLIEAGKPFGIGDFGTYAMASLRVEKGFRAWGSEMNMDTNPLEAGLDAFVKLNKPVNFIGKQSLQKIKQEGLRRRLVHLKFLDGPNDFNADPEGNETVWLDRKVVGNTTSGAFSYKLNCSLAMAYVPTWLAMDGTRVHVELLGRLCPAEVLCQPPVKVHSAKTKAK